MPNYSLVIDSKFRPFTFAELAAPWQMYGEAYKEQEAALADLDTKASVWENMVNKETDPELYQQYKNYADELTSQADVLATQGLTPGARQAIKKLGSRYSKEIVPIEQAFNTRKEQSKMQLQARMTNPSLMFSRDAANTRLLDYVNNPELDFETISGNDITQRVFTQAQALSKELIDNKEDLRKVLGGDYYEYVKQRGFTKEAVLAAIMDSPNASPVLQQLVNDAVASSGVQNWNSQDALDKVTSYARQGLWGAVGTSEAQLVNNWRAQTNLAHANAMALEDKRHDHALEENKTKNSIPFKSSDGKDYWYNPYQGIFTDDKGNLVEKPKDAPEFLGRFKDKDNSSGSSSEPGKPNKYDLSGISTLAGATDAGYTMMGVGMKAHGGDGPWQVFTEDNEDIPGGNVNSFFEHHGWFEDGWIYNRSNFRKSPNNPGNVVIDFHEDEMSLIRDYVKEGGKINDIDDLDPEYRDILISANNYLKSQGIEQGIGDDRIRIAITNTPKEGELNYIIYRR